MLEKRQWPNGSESVEWKGSGKAVWVKAPHPFGGQWSSDMSAYNRRYAPSQYGDGYRINRRGASWLLRWDEAKGYWWDNPAQSRGSLKQGNDSSADTARKTL